MGLDMYLEKRTYVKNWDHMQPQERTTVTVTRGGKPLPGIDPQKITNIVEEAGYWRKANAVHAWFVEHVQDGKDDCGYYYVSEEQLQELLDTVNKVLEASPLAPGLVTNGYTVEGEEKVPIRELGETVNTTWIVAALLPTQEGFFFGGTDYEYYIQDLKATKDILEAALKSKSGDYFYHSSW